MTDSRTPDLVGLCAHLADELDEVTSTADGDAVAYAHGSTVFARVSGPALEVRLPADIAEAALRTPDTATIAERGWVRFSPPTGERHVIDRATAWFQTAWRHAGDE